MKKYIFSLSIVAILLTTGGLSCSSDSTQDQSSQNNNQDQQNDQSTTSVADVVQLTYYAVGDLDQVGKKSKEITTLATNLAKKWQSDAKLVLISTNYFSSLADVGVVDKFLFSSDLKSDMYWSIDISRDDINKYTRTLIYRDDYVLKAGVLPIPMKYWRINYAQSLEIADKLGGAEYRQKYPNYQVSQILSLSGGKNLAWYIVYSTTDNNDLLSVIVDASSGQQIK